MIKKILCQLELQLELLTVGSKKPLLITTLNVMGAFFVLLRIHGYFTREIYLWKVRSHTLTQFSAVKGSFTTIKVSRVTSPIESQRGGCARHARHEHEHGAKRASHDQNMRTWPHVPLFPISFGIVACTFSDNLSSTSRVFRCLARLPYMVHQLAHSACFSEKTRVSMICHLVAVKRAR